MPSISPGRPPTTQNVQTPIRLCPTCLTQIGCGKPHDCSISTRLENLKGIIDVSRPKMDKHVAVSIIENKFDMSSKKPLLFNRVQGGTPMTIRLSAIDCSETKKSSSISFDNFKKMSQHLNHSTNKTLNLAKDLRSARCNRKFITPGLRHDIETSSHRLDNVYTVVTESLKA